MVQLPNSWWGIKDSGQDITRDMMGIIHNAETFVVVGGYNFTFRASGGARPFFDALVNQVNAGVPVLMLFPPNLHGKFNPQPAIIQHCMNNGIAIILNPENHSKWLMTDQQVYYGSSNFTNASWLQRVEVVSLHDHTNINSDWARQTTRDFYRFLQQEIARLNAPARRMAIYPGLLAATVGAWNRIGPLIQRLNPSSEKVKAALSKYDEVQMILGNVAAYWFDHYEPRYFDLIFELSSAIGDAVDQICEYAYCIIYNESIERDEREVGVRIVNEYNRLQGNLVEVIQSAIRRLPEINVDGPIQSEFSQVNLQRINKIGLLIGDSLGRGNY